MLIYYTAGESHGRGIFAFVDGLPAGLRVDRGLMDAALARRQGGYGRGPRMKIEKDQVDVLSGIRGGYTLGSPVILAVWNKDYEDWREFMNPWEIRKGRELFTPRPGHADMAGAGRFRHKDLRNVLERSSARETAGRVAAAGLVLALLRDLGIGVHSWVCAIGTQRYDGGYDRDKTRSSSVYCPNEAATRAMENLIDEAASQGDTLGGEFRVVIDGLPAGIGVPGQWDSRLDTMISASLMSIPGIKAVQIGSGVLSAGVPGSLLHDEILATIPVSRASNNAGGIEGGISNGEPIVVTCTMKPIPTLKKGLRSIDIRDGHACRAEYERSDCCAVPAASVVGEAMVVIAVARAVLNDFSMPNMEALKAAFEAHRTYTEGR
ncbi:MAG: chorismate synthase [Thermodesulfobacteriota bacterium]|nr:chorismate synthase [Thermodesulfobacteriota bacterium]